MDLEASLPTARALSDLGKSFAYVLTKCPIGDSRISEAQALIDKFGGRAGEPLRFRVDFQDASRVASVSAEYKPSSAAAREMQHLWCWTSSRLGLAQRELMTKRKSHGLAASLEDQFDCAAPDAITGDAGVTGPGSVWLYGEPELKIVSDFDYSVFEPADAGFLQAKQQIIGRIGSQAAIAVGTELLDAKELIMLKYRGTWTQWLRNACGFSESTARNCMAAAMWARKSPTVVHLSPGAIYVGARAPEEVQANIVSMINAGRPMTVAEISEMVKKFNAETAEDDQEHPTEDSIRSKSRTIPLAQQDDRENCASASVSDQHDSDEYPDHGGVEEENLDRTDNPRSM